MKTIKLGILCTLVFSFLMTSCRKEEEKEDKVFAVQFKVIATEGVDIKSAVTQIGPDQSIDYFVEGQSWTSESQIVDVESDFIRVASTADAFDADSELIVQILLDGVIVEADTVMTTPGSMNLVAEKSLNFNEL